MLIKKRSKITNPFKWFILSVLFSSVSTQYSIAGLKEQYKKIENCTSGNAQYYQMDIQRDNDGYMYTTTLNTNNFICIINNKVYSKYEHEPSTLAGELNNIFYDELNEMIVDWRIEGNTLVAYLCDATLNKTKCDDPTKLMRLVAGVEI